MNHHRARTCSVLQWMLICLCLALLPGRMARGDDAVQRKFLLDEANMKMSSARAPKEFAAAAATYQKLVDSGVRNGELFYNLGTAFLLAEKYDDARRNLLRAERYIGSNWDIRRNLLIAAAGKNRDRDASLPWYRSLLFWHFELSGATRWGIAVISFFAFWLGLSLRTLGVKRLAKVLVVVSFAGFVVFGSSVAQSLHQEQVVESAWDGKRLP
jgi:hypothetical protein